MLIACVKFKDGVVVDDFAFNFKGFLLIIFLSVQKNVPIPHAPCV